MMGADRVKRWAALVSRQRSNSWSCGWPRRIRRGAIDGSRAPWQIWGIISIRLRCVTSYAATHMDPAPQRRKAGMSWAQFLKLHWEVLAATDFFTVEVATWHGLVTYYVLVVMELATRHIQIAGITPHPTAAFMQQCARQLTDPCEGFLVGKRYVIHDRDTKFTQAFDGLLKTRDRKSTRLNSSHSQISYAVFCLKKKNKKIYHKTKSRL